MRFYFPFCEFAEVDERDVSCFNTWCGHDEIGVVIGERNKIVDLILLELEGFDDMFDFQVEEVNEEDFVVEGDYYFALSDFDLLDF
jgi:hypothetical protein